MNPGRGFDGFSQVLCVSLERCRERRAHMRREFGRVGLANFRFVDAVDKSSEEVARLWESDFVMKYPPCFRCGRDECGCDNKAIFHPQIGNWLSHMQAWRMARRPGGGLTLVCEDDIAFAGNIGEALGVLHASEELRARLGAGEPVLVRLGWALGADHQEAAAPRLTRDIRMANPCYAVNPAMAGLLLDSLAEINTTSDIYLHRIIGSRVHHFTVMPPPVHELSWSTGELLSEIRPKHRHVQYLRRQLRRLQAGAPEYLELMRKIEAEERRIGEYEQFNADPRGDYRTRFPSI